MGSLPPLTILVLGRVSPDGVAPFSGRFHPVELIELGIPASAPISKHRAEFQRAVEAARSPWILLLRAPERAGPGLVDEIAAIAAGTPSIAAARIRSSTIYRGKPLAAGGRREAEIRLFHRQNCRLVAGSEEMEADGRIARLQTPLMAGSFATEEEHLEFLRRRGVPHSLVRRVLLFAARALGGGAWRSANTLRYLWLDAGWDLTGED